MRLTLSDAQWPECQ